MLRISMKKTAAAAVTFAFVAGSLVQTSPIAPITSAHAQQAQLPDFTKLVDGFRHRKVKFRPERSVPEHKRIQN